MDSASHAVTTLRVVAALCHGEPMTAKELMKATGLSDNTISRQLKYMREMSPPLIEPDEDGPRTNGTGPAPKRWRWTQPNGGS